MELGYETNDWKREMWLRITYLEDFQAKIWDCAVIIEGERENEQRGCIKQWVKE